jgi:hypothetical protein
MWTFDIVHAHGAFLSPAVATDIGKSGAGLIADGTPQQLGKAISSLLADIGRPGYMGDIGCTVARDQYSWAVISGQMKAASCLHGRKGRA